MLTIHSPKQGVVPEPEWLTAEEYAIHTLKL